MPFHSVETEDEAKNLITLYCRLNRTDSRHMITRDWDSDDILAAMRSAARQFQLETLNAFKEKS